MTFAAEMNALAPLLGVVLAAAAVLLLTVAPGAAAARRAPLPGISGHLALLALLALGGAILQFCRQAGAAGPSVLHGALIFDGLTAAFGLVAALAAAGSLLFAVPYLEQQGLEVGEFIALLLLACAGMLILVAAGDLLVLFIGLEIMSLAAYVLAGYRQRSRRAQEAALKYFIYGAFAAGFTLYGLALIYGEVGLATTTPRLDWAAIAAAYGGDRVSPAGWFGAALVLSGLAFKIAAAPLHMWAPDVYDGAPTPAGGFLAVGLKAAAFAGLCRFLAAIAPAPQAPLHGPCVVAIGLLAATSMLMGNLLALRQRQLKRLLAYSSVAHAGYALLGVVAFLVQPGGAGLPALAYYLVTYAGMTLGAFGVVALVEARDPERVDLGLERLPGLAQRQPGAAMALAICLLGLAGLPPAAGFAGKLGLLLAAVNAGQLPLAAVAVVASALGVAYYLRILLAAFSPAPSSVLADLVPGGSTQGIKTGAWQGLGLAICAGLVLILGLFPELYLAFASRVLLGWS